MKYKAIKSISMAFLGLSLAITSGSTLWAASQANDTYMKPRKETLEHMYENRTGITDIRSIIILVLGVVLLFLGGSSVVSCIKDTASGPVRITIESTRVGDGKREETQDYNLIAYDLYGVTNLEEFTFRIDAEEMDESLIRKINYLSPEIMVVYYPESKAIIQVQILFAEEDKVILPYGDRVYNSRLLEKLPEGKGEPVQNTGSNGDVAVEATKEPTVITPPPVAPGISETWGYTEIPLEDLKLPEIETGDDYTTVVQELINLPEGESYQMIMPGSNDFENHLRNQAEIKEEYSVSDKQECNIFYKDDIQLILVYHSETRKIEAVHARRLASAGR